MTEPTQGKWIGWVMLFLVLGVMAMWIWKWTH
jgi:hypothetical protein